MNAALAGGAPRTGGAAPGWRALVPWRQLVQYGMALPAGLLVVWLVLWWLIFGGNGAVLPPRAAVDWLLEVVVLCPLVGLGLLAHAQLRMNTPTVARLVPDHPRLVRLVLIGGVGVTLALLLVLVALRAALDGALPSPGALAGLVARHLLVSAVVIATARMDQGWLISVPLALALLAPGRWISGLKPWWPLLEGVAAWPAVLAGAGLVLAAVVSAVGTGDAAHRRAHARRSPPEGGAGADEAGTAAPVGEARGLAAVWARAWASPVSAHLAAQLRHGRDAGARALIALGPRLHASAVWRGALWWLLLVGLQALLAWSRQDGSAAGGVVPSEERLAQVAHRFTVLLGLATAFAVVSTRMLTVTLAGQTVAEQRLMVLTPGVPRGRSLQRRLLGRSVSRTLLWVAVYYGAHAWMQSRQAPLSWAHVDPLLLAAVCLPLWPLLLHDASAPPAASLWWAWVRPLLLPVAWMGMLMANLAGAGVDRGTLLAAGLALSAASWAWGAWRWRRLPEPWPARREGT